ncbi:MAG: hypothetical protein ACRC5T_06645 [Cetobacterium sp.]
MKTVEVNKDCKINNYNIAKSRDDREVSINITQYIEDENGFINYCLAIEDKQQCCEFFGSGFFKVVDFDENKVFVDRINHDIENVTSEWLEEIGFRYNFDDEESEYIIDSGIVSCVYGKDNELLAIAWVYNAHNRYYGHEVFTDINGDIKVSYL